MDSIDRSEFLRRPRSNQVPSEEEIRCIRSLRQECRAGIDVINKQIEELIAQRNCLENDLEQYESLLSPIKQVPGEILSAIFEHATVIPQHAGVLPRVVVSTVCQEWRRLAIETPSLWSALTIITSEHPRHKNTFGNEGLPGLLNEERMWEGRMKKLLEMIPLWIERSKECPVSLILRFTTISISRRNGWGGEDSPAAACSLYQALVNLVCSVAHRWRKIELDIITGESAIAAPLISLKPHDVPQLETLLFQTGNKHIEEDPPFYPFGVLGAQSLRSVFLMKLDRPWTQLPITWAGLITLQFAVQVKELEVGKIPESTIGKMLGPRGVLCLLSACPNLERCELSVRSNDEDPRDWQNTAPTKRAVVRLARLRSLTFHGSEPVEEIVTSLDLPSLQELHFLGSFVGRMNDMKRPILAQRLLCAVVRFGSQLTDIRFSLVLLEDAGSVARCLENLSNILNLHLDSAVPERPGSRAVIQERFESASNSLINALTPGLSEGGGAVDGVKCPKLKRFACTLMMKGFTEIQLLEFIAARSGQSGNSGLAKIEEVEVAFGIPQSIVWR